MRKVGAALVPYIRLETQGPPTPLKNFPIPHLKSSAGTGKALASSSEHKYRYSSNPYRTVRIGTLLRIRDPVVFLPLGSGMIFFRIRDPNPR
jgi:hypothetical protein